MRVRPGAAVTYRSQILVSRLILGCTSKMALVPCTSNMSRWIQMGGWDEYMVYMFSGTLDSKFLVIKKLLTCTSF